MPGLRLRFARSKVDQLGSYGYARARMHQADAATSNGAGGSSVYRVDKWCRRVDRCDGVRAETFHELRSQRFGSVLHR